MKKNMGEALKKDGTNQTSEGIILIQGAYEEILKKQDQEFKERREKHEAIHQTTMKKMQEILGNY
ncbi:hypothetical protein HON22_02950 [Candidatus Peregrinibacteria bacterium]|nr:hypothetical protein [Candidatus Peregrinibacteria bacterium]